MFEVVNETCCFIGHSKVPEEEIKKLKKNLKKETKKLIKKGYKYFLCGCEPGFNTLAALTVLELRKRFKNIQLILVIPYREQSASWSDEDILLYNDIAEKADCTKVLSKIYYEGLMEVHNRYMVDNSYACISYLRKQTGLTASTVEYTQNGEYGKKLECIIV